MGRYTAKDIVNMVREEDVAFIRLQFTDMFGTLKNVAITPAQLLRALSGKVMFNGSSIEGFARIEESDMFLVPDLDTFAIFPWRPQQGKVARMICNVRRTDGTPFEGDSRYILQKAIEDAAREGLEVAHVLDARDNLVSAGLVQNDGSVLEFELNDSGADHTMEFYTATSDSGTGVFRVKLYCASTDCTRLSCRSPERVWTDLACISIFPCMICTGRIYLPIRIIRRKFQRKPCTLSAVS